jgi:membrane protein implicated in regulation of membrane protease activity
MYWWIWIIAGIIFAIVEIFTPGFVSLAIGVACVITGVTSLIPGISNNIALQLVIFSGSMIGLIIVTRPIAKKLQTKNKRALTNVSALVGRIGVVSIKIDNDNNQGYVKIGGEEWSARSQNGDVINIGEKVIVQEVEGNKVIVTNKFLID